MLEQAQRSGFQKLYPAYVKNVQSRWWFRDYRYRGTKDHPSYVVVAVDGNDLPRYEKGKTEPDPDCTTTRCRLYGCTYAWSKKYETEEERDAILKDLDSRERGYTRKERTAYLLDGLKKSKSGAWDTRPPFRQVQVIIYEADHDNERFQPWDSTNQTRLEEAAYHIGISTGEELKPDGTLLGGRNYEYLTKTKAYFDDIEGVDEVTQKIADYIEANKEEIESAVLLRKLQKLKERKKAKDDIAKQALWDQVSLEDLKKLLAQLKK